MFGLAVIGIASVLITRGCIPSMLGSLAMRRLRAERGLSQEALAHMSAASTAPISAASNGVSATRRSPYFSVLQKHSGLISKTW